jgi:hypothetical protein
MMGEKINKKKKKKRKERKERSKETKKETKKQTKKRKKEPPVLRGLGGPQRHFTKEKTCVLLLRAQPKIVQPTAQSLYLSLNETVYVRIMPLHENVICIAICELNTSIRIYFFFIFI